MNAVTPIKEGGNLIPLGPGRELPNNVPAEQALLGAVLIKNDAAADVAFLRPEHFYEGAHGKIYAAALSIIAKGERASPTTLKPYFDNEQSLSEVGGATYLLRLTGAAVSIANIADYGRAVLDCWVRRGIIERAQEAIACAMDASPDETPLDQVAAFSAGLDDLTKDEPRGGFTQIGDAMEVALRSAETNHRKGGQIGISTGLHDLDRYLGGMEPGQLIVLAARPKMGKTATGWHIAFSAARRGVEVGKFSLEMSSEQLAQRTLSERSGINLQRVRKGDMGAHEWQSLTEIVANSRDLPLWIDDTPGLTLARIRSRARTLKRKRPNLGLLLVDYLQLVESSGDWRGNRVQEVTEISKGLKRLARELEVPIIAMAQLNREPEKRDNKRPMLSDLRESGSIEQDADVVLGLFYPHHYEPDEPQDPMRANQWQQEKNVLEVIVLAQRQGPLGTAKVFYDRSTGRMGDLETLPLDAAERR